jgi:DNA-directed RNA polymerase subunit RPC12/RpoP
MWAAAQWASTTQKYSKSRTATAGIRADRCHQEYVDDDAEQGHDHGERVVRSDRQGVEYECAACGSEFAVDQTSGTLVEARRAAADGGTVTEPVETAADAPTTPPTVRFDHDPVVLPRPDTTDCDAAHGDERRTLRERWPSARRAGAIGAPTTERECGHTEPGTCPLCCEEGERVDASVPIPADATPAAATVEERESVDRPPSWRPEAIVQQQTGEETVIGSPGGVAYAELVEEGVGAIPPEKLVDPDILRDPRPWERRRGCARCGSEVVHTASDPTAVCDECGRECGPPDPLPFTKGEIRSGEVPPPELIDRQLSEIHHGDRLTPKEWSDDWHRERHGDPDGTDDDADGPLPWSEIQEYRKENPAATVSELVEEFGVPESARSLVGGVVGPPESSE